MMTNQSVATANDGMRVRGGRLRRPMRPGMVVTASLIVLVLGVLGGAILGHVSAPPVVSASGSQHLYLTVAYNPFTGLDEYFPANFSVPANVPVVITITNYDNGTNLVAPEYSKVLGTVGGTETVATGAEVGSVVSSVPSDQVAHTFTLITGPYAVNVPIPAARDTTPTVVSFTVLFNAPGQFEWHCMAPCDDSAMSTPGFMMGTVTVVG